MRVVLIAFVANTAIKQVVRRSRPDLGPDLPPLVSTISGRSYPSAHATTSFAAAGALSRVLPAPPLYAAAGAMALTRPYLGVHYPSDVVAGARARASPREAAVKIGIVGLPNAGKSSLFNALTRAGAPAANYPFTTLEPNVAVVGVPDERLDRVAETVGATPIVHEVIQFHDIAGLVRGAHQGEGLGNQFLGNIRETDAILHVVRVHDDAQVVHPEGRVDPLADVETIETELLYADLEQAERRLERVGQAGQVGRQGADGRGALAGARWWTRCAPAARCAPCRRPRARPARRPACTALTSKPVLYVANVAEGEPLEPPPALVEHARGARRARDGGERAARGRAGRARRGRGGGDARGARRARVRPRDRDPRGLRAAAPDLVLHRRPGQGGAGAGRSSAAPAPGERPGAVHTDMERGFVAAEVTFWEDLVRAGGYTAAREQALYARGGPRLRDARRRRGDVPLHAVADA